MILALTHEDFADDRELAQTVPGIDLILGGHDHNPITFAERDILIVKAGYDAHYLAAIDLVVDRIKRGDREVVEVVPDSWRYVSTAGVAPDPKIQPVVARYENQLESSSPCRSALQRSPWTRAAAPCARPRATSAT